MKHLSWDAIFQRKDGLKCLSNKSIEQWDATPNTNTAIVFGP